MPITVYRLLLNDVVKAKGTLRQVMDAYARLLHLPAGPLKFGDRIEVLEGSLVLEAWAIQ